MPLFLRKILCVLTWSLSNRDFFYITVTISRNPNWKLLSPDVRNCISKLAFKVKQPKETKIIHLNFSNSFLVASLKCMLIGGQKDPFIHQCQLLEIIPIEAGTRESWHIYHSIY